MRERFARLDDVARLIGDASEGNRRVAALVRLTQTATGAWHVVLTTHTEDGTRSRSFDAESCEAAAAGVAFILAITENPAVAPSRSAEAPPAPLASLPPPAPGPPAAAPEPETPTRPPIVDAAPPVRKAAAKPEEARTYAPDRTNARRAFDGVVAVGIGTDTGTLPRPTLGPIASVGLAPGRWRFDLTGAYWTSQSATQRAGAAGATFEAWSAEARATHGWLLGPLSSGPSPAWGSSRSTRRASVAPPPTSTSALSPGPSAGADSRSWRPGGAMALRIEVEGEVPFERPSFHVKEPVPPNSMVFQLRVAMARASLGADIVF